MRSRRGNRSSWPGWRRWRRGRKPGGGAGWPAGFTISKPRGARRPGPRLRSAPPARGGGDQDGVMNADPLRILVVADVAERHLSMIREAAPQAPGGQTVARGGGGGPGGHGGG